MKGRLIDCVAILSIAMMILLLADWHHSYYKCEVVLFSGPAGRPLIITAGRGLLYVAVANVPVANSLPLSFDLRSSAPGSGSPEDRFEEAAEVSDFHFGYRAMQTPQVAMSSTTTMEPDAFGFSLIAGKNMLGIPGTFYALASIPFWANVPSWL